MSGLQSAANDWFAAHGIDAATALVSLAYLLWKRSRETQPKAWLCAHTGYQFFSGLAVLPLLLLFAGAFSETMLKMLLKTNGAVLAGAAAVALGALLEDRDA